MNKKHLGRELSPAEAQLLNIQEALDQAPQKKLFNVRTRFEGLLNAYADDQEATTMLKFLMAEYSLQQKVNSEVPNGSDRRNAVNVH